jgi:hypothetical protein
MTSRIDSKSSGLDGRKIGTAFTPNTCLLSQCSHPLHTFGVACLFAAALARAGGGAGAGAEGAGAAGGAGGAGAGAVAVAVGAAEGRADVVPPFSPPLPRPLWFLLFFGIAIRTNLVP